MCQYQYCKRKAKHMTESNVTTNTRQWNELGASNNNRASQCLMQPSCNKFNRERTMWDSLSLLGIRLGCANVQTLVDLLPLNDAKRNSIRLQSLPISVFVHEQDHYVAHSATTHHFPVELQGEFDGQLRFSDSCWTSKEEHFRLWSCGTTRAPPRHRASPAQCGPREHGS